MGGRTMVHGERLAVDGLLGGELAAAVGGDRPGRLVAAGAAVP